MQLNKKLAILAITTTAITLNAASDEVSYKFNTYKESDDRIKVKYHTFDVKKDFGADYSLSLSLSHDTITGGTPAWDSISGGSKYTGKLSDDANCISGGKNICKDTSNLGILNSGKLDMSDYNYRNINMEDKRKAGSISLTKRTQSRDEIGLGLSYSKEEDFRSIEGSFSYLYNLNASRNRSLSFGVSYQSNEAKFANGWKDFYIINSEIGYTHVFTKNTLASFSVFGIKQSGELSNPYQRVIRYFDALEDNSGYYKYFIANEKRPDEKFSYGFSTKVVSQMLNFLVLHANYRLYQDNWGITSHTIATQAYIDLGKYITIVPFLRYYHQSEANFYKAYNAKDFTFNATDYASNDKRLSSFNTKTAGLGIIGKVTKNFSLNAYYTMQKQSTDLDIKYFSVGFKYKF